MFFEKNAAKVKFDAFFYNVTFHEVAHGLGIKNTINGKGGVRQALGNQYSSWEEAKADILGLYMDATVYVQSITPVCESKAKANGYKLENEIIQEYNEALIEMVGEKGVYYLDIHSALCDETGALPENATTDGLHFGSQYYQKWINYLLTHTV